ncbi:uncharacterized protein V6R79_005647 [Siganus canaliculatus]
MFWTNVVWRFHRNSPFAARWTCTVLFVCVYLADVFPARVCVCGRKHLIPTTEANVNVLPHFRKRSKFFLGFLRRLRGLSPARSLSSYIYNEGHRGEVEEQRRPSAPPPQTRPREVAGFSADLFHTQEPERLTSSPPLSLEQQRPTSARRHPEAKGERAAPPLAMLLFQLFHQL